MHRIYVLIPSVEVTASIVHELQQMEVPLQHMHTVASIDQSLQGLPEASIWQKTELAHGLEWGTGLGGTAGLLGGLLTVVFPPGGVALGGGVLLIGAAAGAGVGAAMMGLMKGHEHNHQLDDFKKEIEQGEILLMVDLAKHEVEEITRQILKHHPGGDIRISRPKT